MMNKKIPLIFSVPPFMSPNEDFAKNEHQLNSIAESFNVHLDFLKNQMFCLKIKDFFKNNSEAEQISFQATQESDQDGNYIDVSVCVDGDFDDDAHHFFCEDMSRADKNYLHESMSVLSDGFVVDRSNQEKAFADWMGSADFKKWHSLYTEENLLNLLPENILKPKKANRL